MTSTNFIMSSLEKYVIFLVLNGLSHVMMDVGIKSVRHFTSWNALEAAEDVFVSSKNLKLNNYKAKKMSETE